MDPGAKSKVYPGGFKARQSFAAMEVDQADKGRVRAKERTKEKAGLGVLVLGVEEEKMEKDKGKERQRQKEKVRKEVQSVAATLIGAVNGRQPNSGSFQWTASTLFSRSCSSTTSWPISSTACSSTEPRNNAFSYKL